MPTPLLTITNVHGQASLHFDNSNPKIYTSYFENEHGEQWMFRYDRESHKAFVTGGDIDWEETPIIGGTVGDLMLNKPEFLWLAACCMACRVPFATLGAAGESGSYEGFSPN